MEITLKSSSLSKGTEKVQIFALFKFDKNPKLKGELQHFTSELQSLAKDKVFNGKESSYYFLRNTKGKSILVLGLGDSTGFSPESLRCAGSIIYKVLTKEKVSHSAIDLDSFLSFSPALKSLSLTKKEYLQALLQGITLTSYSFEQYKKKKKESPIKAIYLYSSKKEPLLQQGLKAAVHTKEAVFIARDLSNEPPNVIYPESLAKRVQKYAKDNKLSCKVLSVSDLKKEKMGGILGVGQGSSHPPCAMILEHKPKQPKKNAKRIALVGKAVTFDTGGISLKPGRSMDEMKHDMSGAANLLGATILAANLGCQNYITTYIMAAENMPDGNAIPPGTILNSRAGITVEVLNTDAEGRLLLMDGLDYAQDKKIDAVIDMATLTGAILVSLASSASGIMGNDAELMNKFKKAADKTQEKHWELPMYKEFSEVMKGKYADLQNIGDGSGAGSSTAAAFLQYFIKPKNKWIHIDCAGSAWNQKHLPYSGGGGATGHGIRTVAQFMMDF